MIIFKAKLSDNLSLFFPGGVKFWLQNMQNSFSERGVVPFKPRRGLGGSWTPTISAEMVLDHCHLWLKNNINLRAAWPAAVLPCDTQSDEVRLTDPSYILTGLTVATKLIYWQTEGLVSSSPYL